MKRLRQICIAIIAVGLLANATLLNANDQGAGQSCCATAYDHCNLTICEGRGGALLCQTHIGSGCSDLCYCADGYYVQSGWTGGACGACVE